MAEDILRSRHAFGSESGISQALADGKIDAYDILFLKEGKIGWIDKDGNPIILEDKEQIIRVDELPTSDGDENVVYIYNNEGYIWNGTECVSLSNSTDVTELTEKVTALETEVAAKANVDEVNAELALKANAEEVEAKISEVDAKFGKYEAPMYEIVKTPDGTLVDYDEQEIRIMIPNTTDFTQTNGVNGAENMFYIENRVYAPEDAVRYRVNFGGTVTEGAVEDFADCTDEYGRTYLVVCPPVAYYDTESATWVYYGTNSTTDHYIGWNQITDWYDADGVMIASDSVRINLSNEDCHFEVKPYYVGELSKEINTKIEEMLTDLESAYTIVEF